MKRLPWIESLLFFFSWTLIMLSGADFPPPVFWIYLGDLDHCCSEHPAVVLPWLAA